MTTYTSGYRRSRNSSDVKSVVTPRRIFLTQGFGEGVENALCLTVSRFEPGPGDRTAYFWTDSCGQPRPMEMPPYFISDMDAARQNIREFLHNARSVYIETLLGDSNPMALVYAAFGQVNFKATFHFLFSGTIHTLTQNQSEQPGLRSPGYLGRSAVYREPLAYLLLRGLAWP